MKIALITDTHWGVRNDSPIQHDAMKKFLDEVFFPKLKEENITTVIHGGDLVDRRKYVNFVTAKRLREDFLDPLKKLDIELHIIAGNHDTFYKNTNDVNALEELIGSPKADYVVDTKRYNKVYIYYKQPCTIHWNTSDPGIFLIPWITDSNRDVTMKMIKETKAPIAIGHLELNGFEMYKGNINTHGDDPKLFDKFDLVLSGHYHTRSSSGNIHYLGTPVQYTWSDYNDPKGFHVLDTETRELTFIENPDNLFHRFMYDDLNKEMDEVVVFDADKYKNCYVKVIIKNKINPYWFDLVIDKLEKSGVVDLQVVEDHHHLDLEQDDDIISEAEDTVTILRKYIHSMNVQTDKTRVENLLQNLYSEALAIE